MKKGKIIANIMTLNIAYVSFPMFRPPEYPGVDYNNRSACFSSLGLHTIDEVNFSSINCEEVKSLDLSDNAIGSFQLKELLDRFPRLSTLNLSHNQITSISEQSLDRMPNGFVLDLSYNRPLLKL